MERLDHQTETLKRRLAKLKFSGVELLSNDVVMEWLVTEFYYLAIPSTFQLRGDAVAREVIHQ